MNDLGPLSSVVQNVGFIVAAAATIFTLWAGKASWAPQVANFEKGPSKWSLVLSATAIGLLYIYRREHSVLANLAVVFVFIALVALCLDLLIRKLTIIKCDHDKRGIIGGLWLSPEAKKILSGSSKHILPHQLPPETVKDLFCNSGRNPDRIWSNSSQITAQLLVTLAYMVWRVAITLAPATVALLIA